MTRKEYNKKYRETHKEYFREYDKNRKGEKSINDRLIKAARINSWIGYIPKETNCEICGKKIFFKGHVLGETIHFDHKHENSIIKENPSHWIRRKFRTKENQKIWESCKFGFLCRDCNTRLPTKNRKEWIRKADKYAS